MLAGELQTARVLVVDDEPESAALLEGMLRGWGLESVTTTRDSRGVVDLCEEVHPDLLLLDLEMPPPDGLEVMRQLRDVLDAEVPLLVLVMTANAAPGARQVALEHGARDFVTKPFDPEEVRFRVENLLRIRYLQRRQQEQTQALEQRVLERTAHLERAQVEILERLALAAEYRDDDTGEHTARVARTVHLVATALGLDPGEVRKIELAAPLHDVGKIAVPDRILLKPGKLTDEEFDTIKQHTRLGSEMLAGSESAFLATAEEIALTHHERWDGRGYGAGLSGEEIPLAGRIVAVADVFDALAHRRPYKEPWPLDRAVDEVLRAAGTQFDPAVVEAFAAVDHRALLAPAVVPYRGVPPEARRPVAA